MRRHELMVLGLCAVALLGGADRARAQSGSGQGAAASAGEAPVDLVYEREVFIYPAHQRRDPFTPLIGQNSAGPRMEDLRLKGIIYSPSGSVALLEDGNGRSYRVRRGQVVGNARVVEIQPLRVLFAVENFGIVRQEVLELKREKSEGAER